MQRRRQRGMTLVELIVAFTILMVLTSMAVPLARYKVQRDKERDLERALVQIRNAIDKFKDDMDAQKIGPATLDSQGSHDQLLRVGSAQHTRRYHLTIVGRPERLQRIHQEHGQGTRWNSL